MEWEQLIVALGASIVAAAVALLTWYRQRVADRQRERTRLAGLYVNPFLMACQDLQSRLYNMLENDGLSSLTAHYPDGNHAWETLYLMASYFGWEGCISRHGPYTHNGEMIVSTEKIRDAFASNSFGLGAFCFFRTQQRALGQKAVIRTGTESAGGAEYDTLDFSKFVEELKTSALGNTPPIPDTMKLLMEAESADDLKDHRRRLATIQNLLSDLLEYAEKREGFTLFYSESFPKRLRARLEVV